jgi:hypothetical protein
MLFTLKCCCLAVLFCLVTGVEAVTHEWLSSPAFDPLSGFKTRRLRVNRRYRKTHWSNSWCLRPGCLVSQPIPRTAPRCGPYWRPPLSGYWRVSLSGSAIIGTLQCGLWVRQGWHSA